MIDDTLVAGAFSGVVGALVQASYGLTIKFLGLTDRTFTDFAKVFFMYKNYQGFLAFLAGLIIHMAIGATLGVGFAYLIKFTSDKYYYIKGLGYGAFIWLLMGCGGTVFNIPLFKEIPPHVVLVTLGGALIYGIVISFALKKVSKKTVWV
jgi:hypothetical protein